MVQRTWKSECYNLIGYCNNSMTFSCEHSSDFTRIASTLSQSGGLFLFFFKINYTLQQFGKNSIAVSENNAEEFPIIRRKIFLCDSSSHFGAAGVFPTGMQPAHYCHRPNNTHLVSLSHAASLYATFISLKRRWPSAAPTVPVWKLHFRQLVRGSALSISLKLKKN